MGAPAKLKIHRDAAGLRHLPARIGLQSADPVFDTGANFSVASESFANSHQIELLANSLVAVDSATGNKVWARVGLGDVQIGRAHIRHVVFLVMKDDDLEIRQLSLKIPAILGFPVVRALGHIRFTAAGTIQIGLKAMPAGRPELALDGLTPLVRVQFKDQEMPFVLDTGAGRTSLSKHFASRFPEVLSNAEDRPVQRMGAGAVTTGMTRVLPTITFHVAGVPITLHNVGMGAEAAGDETVFGRVGEDVAFARGACDIDFRALRLAIGPARSAQRRPRTR